MIHPQLKTLYEKFLTQDMSVFELQSRLQTMIVDDKDKKLQSLLHEVDNRLEVILFTIPEQSQRKHAIEALRDLLNEIK